MILPLIPGTARADFVGDTVGLVYYYPDSSTVFANLGTGVVPTVFDLFPAVCCQADGTSYPGSYSATVTANQIIVSLNPDDPNLWNTFASFNGWVLTDITQDPGITGVTIGSQSNFALDASMISFTSDSSAVNWIGLPASHSPGGAELDDAPLPRFNGNGGNQLFGCQ
jgi:hypothetical protein